MKDTRNCADFVTRVSLSFHYVAHVVIRCVVMIGESYIFVPVFPLALINIPVFALQFSKMISVSTCMDAFWRVNMGS